MFEYLKDKRKIVKIFEINLSAGENIPERYWLHFSAPFYNYYRNNYILSIQSNTGVHNEKSYFKF